MNHMHMKCIYIWQKSVKSKGVYENFEISAMQSA